MSTAQYYVIISHTQLALSHCFTMTDSKVAFQQGAKVQKTAMNKKEINLKMSGRTLYTLISSLIQLFLIKCTKSRHITVFSHTKHILWRTGRNLHPTTTLSLTYVRESGNSFVNTSQCKSNFTPKSSFLPA